MSLRVGLVVDNPSRDLDGLVLLGRELILSGCFVFLVPMYSQGIEVPVLNLDVVVLNYVRKNNVALINAYKSVGIKVVILDTEGGVWDDEKQFVDSIDHRTAADMVSKYLVWGDRQKAALIKYTSISPEKIWVTGNPRYDFYSQRLVGAIADLPKRRKLTILVISNFSLSNPRFSSVAEEKVNLQASGYDKAHVDRLQQLHANNRSHLKNLVTDLASDFGHAEIIVRTHPFEQNDDYLRLYSTKHNVTVESDGTIAAQLKRCDLVIHFNSSVAIDAYMIQRPAFVIGWTGSELTRKMAPVTYDLSQCVKEYGELKDAIEAINDGCLGFQKITFSSWAQDQFRGWFHQPKITSAELIAQILDSTITESASSYRKTRFRMTKVSSNLKHPLIGKADYWGRLVLGVRLGDKVRGIVSKILQKRGGRQNKTLDVTQVSALLEKLRTVCDNNANVTACPAPRSELINPLLSSASIMLKRVSKST